MCAVGEREGVCALRACPIRGSSDGCHRLGGGVGRSGARTFDLVLKRVREEWKWTVLGGKLVIRSCGVEASFLGFLTR